MNSVRYEGQDIGDDVSYIIFGGISVNGVPVASGLLAHHLTSMGNFGPGAQHNYGTAIEFFQPGCCGGAAEFFFHAEVTEYDIWPDDDESRLEVSGMEGTSIPKYSIKCGGAPQEFTFLVRVVENSSSTGVFRFSGMLTATCEG